MQDFLFKDMENEMQASQGRKVRNRIPICSFQDSGLQEAREKQQKINPENTEMLCCTFVCHLFYIHVMFLLFARAKSCN